MTAGDSFYSSNIRLIFKNHHEEQLKLVSSFDRLKLDALPDVKALITKILSNEEAQEYIKEGRISAITESVERRNENLSDMVESQTKTLRTQLRKMWKKMSLKIMFRR